MCECQCHNKSPELAKLAIDYADAGGWEEFHQKRGDGYMQAYWKNLRMKIQAKIKAIKGN